MLTRYHRKHIIQAAVTSNLRKQIRKDKKRVRNEAIKLLLSQYVRAPILERRILPERGALNFYFNELFNLPEDLFQANMRLSRQAFDSVYRIIRSAVPVLPNKGYPLKMKFAAVLYFLSSSGDIKDCAERFGIGESTLQGWYVYICGLIIESMQNAIRWPAPGSDESKLIQTDFVKRSKRPYPFLNVVGAIDSSLIQLSAKPACDGANMYFDRKKTVSVHLQAVVDARGRFLHVEAGAPGSVHDSTVLRGSELFQTIGDRIQPPCYLLGDKGYPLLDWLMTPYRQRRNQLIDEDRQCYNDIHSETRIVVEHAFGWLKARFRRLLCLSVDIFNVPNVIIACCILHNVCIDFGLPSPNIEIPQPADLDDVEDSHCDQFDPNEWMGSEVAQKRNSIKQYLYLNNFAN